jgi:hypothetical protein
MRIQNTASITLPVDGLTLNSLVEGELGCFQCTEARFDSDCWWCSHDSSPVTILLSISSPSSAYRKICCKDSSIQLIFSRSFNSLLTHGSHNYRNSKWSCIMLYAKPWEIPSAVATPSIVILLSARINSSTCCRVASVAISTGDLVGHHLWLSNDLEGIYRPSGEPLYTTNTSHRKQETILYEHSLHKVFLHTKDAQENAVQAWSPLWLLKAAASEKARELFLPILLWNWTLLLPSDTNRKTITSITADLLPFVTYLLTLSRILCHVCWKPEL